MRLNLRVFTCVWMLLLLANAGQAQDPRKYKPARLVTAAGDTVSGLMEYHKWVKNPKRVHLITEDGEDKYFNPEDAAWFTVEEERYLSRIVDLDISPTEDNELQYETEPTMKRDTLFLRVLFEGMANLYFFREEKGKIHFFLEMEDVPAVELVYFKHRRLNEIRQSNQQLGPLGHIITTEKRYVNQLYDKLRACTSMIFDIEKLQYRMGPMIKLFAQYHQCVTGEGPTYAGAATKGFGRFGVIAGVASHDVNFSGSQGAAADFSALSFDRTPDFYVAATYQLLLPSYYQQWSLHTELGYLGLNLEGSGVREGSRNQQYSTDAQLELDFLRASGLFRWSPRKRAVNPLLGFGLSLGYYLNRSMIQETLVTDVANPDRGTRVFRSGDVLSELEGYRVTEQAMIGEVGIAGGAWTASARAEIGTGISSLASVGSYRWSYLLTLGYFIGQPKEE